MSGKWTLKEHTGDASDPKNDEYLHHDYTIYFDGDPVAYEGEPMSYIEARQMIKSLNKLTMKGVFK